MFHCDVVDVTKNKITLEKAQAFIESHKCGSSIFLFELFEKIIILKL